MLREKERERQSIECVRSSVSSTTGMNALISGIKPHTNVNLVTKHVTRHFNCHSKLNYVITVTLTQLINTHFALHLNFTLLSNYCATLSLTYKKKKLNNISTATQMHTHLIYLSIYEQYTDERARTDNPRHQYISLNKVIHFTEGKKILHKHERKKLQA